ncbi:MAG: CBS and ACT domain-containing protein [Anaerolineae bacterium]|jgi:acetoin utilization protein AcuB|nr:CBS and ACT domain-containing protein [Anaerolineae bacterium]
MLVGERMTRNPVTILDTASIDDGIHLMRERKVRRLPVLDESGKMVGIVSDKDLLHAAPSPATSLSVYELHYLLAKLTIKQVMSSPVISVSPDTPLEEAARVMADNKIGGLPVSEGDKLVGIITETDVFKILVELLGARTPGQRVTIRVTEGKGVLARLTQALSDLGANIISVVTYAGANASERLIMVKLSDADSSAVRGALAGLGVEVVDFRGE